MIEPYFLGRNAALIEAMWQEKNVRAGKILGTAPFRQLRPEVLGDRARLDLMWNGLSFGLRGPDRREGDRRAIERPALSVVPPPTAAASTDRRNPDARGDYAFSPVRDPDAASKDIRGMLRELESDPPPLELAQFRFRSGPLGHRGLWIDTSNEQIRDLLTEAEWLKRALGRDWVVEVGQKHKEVVLTDEGPRLAAAIPRPWLDSYDVNNDAIGLLSTVASFSQAGPEVNRALLAVGFDLLDAFEVREMPWREWGAGYGNLSAAYATRLGPKGWVSEADPFAAELLELNRERYFHDVVATRALAEGDFTKDGFRADLWLIDPPRSGFAKLLAKLGESAVERPKWVLAYHCHVDGLTADVDVLRGAGYKLAAWSSVDAFPATPHHEVVSLWERGSPA